MMKFLASHQELLVEVRSLSQSGLIVNLPSGFKIDETIKPVLLVKEENRSNLSADVRLKI